jgi:Secretion system C-terminal sorting domain
MGKYFYNNLIRSIIGIFLFVVIGSGQNAKTPGDFGADVVKFKEIHLLQKGITYNFEKDINTVDAINNNTTLAGFTFKEVAFDEENGIENFTKNSARTYLKRDLFNAPEYTATYYYAKYDKNILNVESTYLQFVSDGEWNRVLYGSLNGVFKSYNAISNPGEITINSAGQVFIAERGKSRIQVLQITGKNENISLDYLYGIDDLGKISSIAYNDGGTPFDLNDDFLFSADASANIIIKIKISGNTAYKENTFKGFQWPVAISFGRWNGANTNDLYVIDTYAKKLSLFQLRGNDLILRSEIQADQAQTFSAVEVDHFGQLYLSDVVNSGLFKYTADLNLLDACKASEDGINDINIPFGTIDLNGEKYWTGFDQAFVIQKWNDESGVKRYKLGVALNAFDVSLSADNQSLQADFKLTEFANSSLRIVDDNDKEVYQSAKITVPSGENDLLWDRSTNDNEQIAPGYYKLKLEIQSLYDESILGKEKRFYLPLYYHINCGNEDATKAVQKINGNAGVINGETVSRSADRIEYKISGLDPSSEYKLAARFLNESNEERYQQLLIDGIALEQSFRVTHPENKTDFIEIPSDAFQDGEITVQIKRAGAGDVNVADIWLSESGREFTFTDPKEIAPVKYKLEQNYPNPFNPSTTISYQLVKNSDVLLTIYDVTGREIKILVNSYQGAGKYNVVFDASRLSSGIYFYKLTTRDFSETRKMVLLK